MKELMIRRDQEVWEWSWNGVGKNGRVAVLIGWDLGKKMTEDGSLGQECVFGVKCLFEV